MTENEKKHCATLEAFLFYYGEPASLKKIAHTLSIKEDESEKYIELLKADYHNNENRGIMLIESERGIQLATKPSLHSIGEKLLREELRETLTPAALETLALIAYTGPLSRSTIDYVRGVNSSFILRNLLVRGLVDRTERGKGGYSYAVSGKFLEHLGLDSIQHLPEYENYKNILEKFETGEENIQQDEQKNSVSL